VSSDCLFCAIAAGDIPADIVHRDEQVIAFRDIDPKAPVHVLVVPTTHYATAAEMGAADSGLSGRVLAVAGEVAAAEGIAESGYRIVANTGDAAGQTVHHVHVHVLGGRDLTWPPG
jgi:histidine triad (HIT) family protein